MRSMDSPRTGRPLGADGGAARDADQWPRAELDGSAREPAELLDQLRQRLDRLGENHPSSPRGSGRQRGDGHGPGPGVGDAAQDAAPADSDAAPADSDAAPADRQEPANAADCLADATKGSGYGVEPAREREPAGEEPAASADEQEADAEQEAGDGSEHLGEFDAGDPVGLGGATAHGEAGDAAEAYRPWFMSQDDSVPWFATDPGGLG